jgi:hypothetical protein
MFIAVDVHQYILLMFARGEENVKN